jgi:pheromone shutdown protein TraB
VVTLIGTGHVFNIRARVQEEIFRRAPTLVCLELDRARFEALQRPPEKPGHAPLVYRLLASFQARVADQYGVRPGDEMLAAFEAARDTRAQVALIDRDARATVDRLLAEMRFGEKMKILGAALASAVVPGKSVEAQVDEMTADYATYFAQLGKKFPTLKRVLLDERNEHMAAQVAYFAAEHPTLVAVVGDGHVDGMSAILAAKAVPFEAVRLKDLRTAAPAPGKVGGTSSATVSFDTGG